MSEQNGSKNSKWSEGTALTITGICLGWLECSRSVDDVSAILGIAVTIIAGTVLLGASVKLKPDLKNENWMMQLTQAKKSVWPFAIFLIGFTLGPVLIELFTGVGCQ